MMQQNGDLTHCYFCYRWFLLDFKRGRLLDLLTVSAGNKGPGGLMLSLPGFLQ